MPIGLLIWPLGLFVFLAESNATNLTDGLDGLASGCGALVFSGLALQLMLRGNSGDPALAGFCMAMAGAWLGFLIHNRNPARAFMGDTGSLALGGSLGVIAVLIHQPFALVIAGGVFVIEAMSVMIQTVWFKYTRKKYGEGRRVFLMAPLHHHFEKKGWHESQVVARFYILGILFAVLALSTLKMR